jgi:hypothetical protein
MKKGLLLLLSSVLMVSAFAQSEKYVKAMEPKVALLDSSNSPDSWKDMANSFERIGDAEKTAWLPYYYAAFCQVMAGTLSMPQDGSFGDNSAIADPMLIKQNSLSMRRK